MIANVSESDAGLYQCLAFNPVLGTRVRSPRSYRLTVTGKSGLPVLLSSNSLPLNQSGESSFLELRGQSVQRWVSLMIVRSRVQI